MQMDNSLAISISFFVHKASACPTRTLHLRNRHLSCFQQKRDALAITQNKRTRLVHHSWRGFDVNVEVITQEPQLEGRWPCTFFHLPSVQRLAAIAGLAGALQHSRMKFALRNNRADWTRCGSSRTGI
jgi:hypothetical protein